MSLMFLVSLVFQLSAINDVSQAASKKVKLTLACDSGDKSSPVGKAMREWARIIEEKSGGSVRVNVFYQGELGGQQELFDQLLKGNVDMMLTWPQTSYDRRFGINYVPYLVLDWEDALKSYGREGWLKKIVEPVYKDVGLKYFGPFPEGFGGVATKGKVATNYEDAQGIKLRTQQFFPLPQTVKAMGFSPVPIDWNEVYTSIQTGVVDGDSSNIIYWDYEYFGDQLDYFVHSGHNFSSAVLIMNYDKWNNLNAATQTIVDDAAQSVIEAQFVAAKKEDDKWIEAAQKGGIKYIVPSQKEKAAWIEKVRSVVWPEIEEQLGKELMDEIRKNTPMAENS